MPEPAKKQLEDEEDEITPEVPEEEELEYEIIDDTPEEDKNKKVAPLDDTEGDEDITDEPSEEELKSYSDRVKKRISALTAKRHEERRAKEQAIRQLEELTNISRVHLDEINKLKEAVSKGETFWQKTNQGKLEAEIAQARREYQEAYEAGDSEKVANAQDRLTELRVSLERTKSYRPRQPDQIRFNQYEEPRQRAAPQVEPDEKAEAWADKNKWFGKDDLMTYFAMGKHQELMNKGVDPTSDDYYKAIDKSVREKFPEAFPRENGSGQHPLRAAGSDVVAPAKRTGKTSRKIQLTASQVAIAKRLGITPKRYAEEMLKQQEQENE